MGVARGEDAKLDLVGFELSENPIAELNIPTAAEIGLLNTALSLPSSITNPVSLIVSDLPLVTESENVNNLPAEAREISLKPGESQTIDVEIQRADRFDKNGSINFVMTTTFASQAVSVTFTAAEEEH